MKTVFIAIAFGTSVRDVLRNDTYNKLLGRKDLRIVLFAQDVSENFKSEFSFEDKVQFEPLFPVKPTLAERILLHFHRATLRDRCRTIDLGNTSGDTSAIDRFTPLARFALLVLGQRGVNVLIYRLYKIFAKRTDYKELFKKYQPDLVVVTRVLNYSADYPIMRTADLLKVPVIALVSSWDNLTSKAFFPFSLEKLVVWNEVLKDEALSLFHFPEERIEVTGIPRYDLFFRETDFRTEKTFRKDWGIGLDTRIICYCTGSETTGRSSMDPISPEIGIAKFLATENNNGSFGQAIIIVRLHPQANLDHYVELKDIDGVILNAPGLKGDFQDRVFSGREDVEFGELMKYSDVVVNFASTVTIDAAVFDTPIVCVNFDFNGERPYGISPRRLYDFDHYAKLRTMNGFKFADSREQLVSKIVGYLDKPSCTRDGRKAIVDQQCVFTDGNSGARNAKVILKALKLEDK